jgi:hypothetical protein
MVLGYNSVGFPIGHLLLQCCWSLLLLPSLPSPDIHSLKSEADWF